MPEEATVDARSSVPPIERVRAAIEWAALIAAPVGLLICTANATEALSATPTTAMLAAALLPILPGAVAIDIFAGIVHFTADNFGDEDMPVLGPTFIRKFRTHHTDPEEILRLPLRDVAGGPAVLATPVIMAAAFLLDPANLWAMVLCSFFTSFVGFGLLTNIFHRQAHAPKPYGWVIWLQKKGLILTPEHHQIHHTPPYDCHYCITFGWLNPALDRIGFWSGLHRFYSGIGLQPAFAGSGGSGAGPESAEPAEPAQIRA